MPPASNEQYVCRVCRKEIPENEELILLQEFTTVLWPNGTDSWTPRSVETPAAEAAPISSDERQSGEESQILPSTSPPEEGRVKSSATQTSLTLFGPSPRNPRVEYFSKNIALYKAAYDDAVAISLSALETTMASAQAVHRAVDIAADLSSKKKLLSGKVRQLFDSLIASRRSGRNLESVYSEYSRTLAAVQATSAEEHDALCLFREAVVEQAAAFEWMVEAASRKHEAFNTALRAFLNVEGAINYALSREQTYS